jgi:alkylated DNA repair dioxygenase AlkB
MPSVGTIAPPGFSYQPEFITAAAERALLEQIATLQFRPFQFGPYTAKRRVAEYGLTYDFGARESSTAPPLPQFLVPLRNQVAEFAGIPAEKLAEAIVTEYPSGAPIGWHRDLPQFGDVYGVSLLSSCRMRFKPYGKGNSAVERGKRPVSIQLEPRSLYAITGESRTAFQHSIPPVEELRYSITFRTLRSPGRE